MIDRNAQTAQALPQAGEAGGVTELVLTHNAPEQTQLLLPTVAHLSRRSQRWLTWISPGPVDRELLHQYDVAPENLRVIHAPASSDQRWILWEALVEGNSHTVIASPGRMTDNELTQLEAAARRGQCQALLLRLR